jgi:hypothetical protein
VRKTSGRGTRRTCKRLTFTHQVNDADALLKENLWTRVRDGCIHARYFNFRLMRMEYIGKWDMALQRFV